MKKIIAMILTLVTLVTLVLVFAPALPSAGAVFESIGDIITSATSPFALPVDVGVVVDVPPGAQDKQYFMAIYMPFDGILNIEGTSNLGVVSSGGPGGQANITISGRVVGYFFNSDLRQYPLRRGLHLIVVTVRNNDAEIYGEFTLFHAITASFDPLWEGALDFYARVADSAINVEWDDNDTPQTATRLPPNETWKGNVSSGGTMANGWSDDLRDYWKFTLTAKSEVTIESRSVDSGTLIRGLTDSEGKSIGFPDRYHNREQGWASDTYTLDAGDYWIRISANDNWKAYELRYSFNPLEEESPDPPPPPTPNTPLDGAATWAVPELKQAMDAGLLIDAMHGNWTQPTSRLLAAEAIVKLIEVSTGKTIEQIAAEKNYDMTNHFSDTASKYVTFLREAGVTTGVGGGRYDTDGTYNRAQMVTMLWRTATNVLDLDLSGYQLGTDVFTDNIPNWAGTNEAIGWAAEMGITTGVSSTRFDSFGVLQNQQTGVFSFRAFDKAFG